MEKKFFENRKEARISEIQEDVLTRELELLKEREQDLLEQLNRTRGAITSKECKLALRKGETKLIKEELAGAVKREETIKKHKEAFKKGESKLE